MLIEKEDRLSRPTSPRRRSSSQGYSRRRPPRNWQKTVRLALYGLIGALALVAALASAALLLDRGGPRKTSAPSLVAEIAPPPAEVAPPSAAPAMVVPPSPLPPVAAVPATVPSAPAPPASPDSRELSALQAQIRQANARLAALQAQAEQARRLAVAATGQREAAQADAARQHATVEAAQTDERRRQAAEEQTRRESDAAEAEQRRQQAQQAQERAAAAWIETERRIQALAQQALPPSTPVKPALTAPTDAARGPPANGGGGATAIPRASPPSVRSPSEADEALTEPPGRADSAAGASRPRVFLRYRSGSPAAQQAATEIAKGLLFSDYAYADTRSSANVLPAPTVRYFYPEDAAAAGRLAALLAWTRQDFQIQDASDHRRGVARGTLEVWVGQ